MDQRPDEIIIMAEPECRRGVIRSDIRPPASGLGVTTISLIGCRPWQLISSARSKPACSFTPECSISRERRSGVMPILGPRNDEYLQNPDCGRRLRAARGAGRAACAV